MAKASKGKGKGTVVDLEGPEKDPQVLYKNYTNQCTTNIGIEPFGPLKEALLNEENPNRGAQIIILPRAGEDCLGSGGCRALVNAIISKDGVPFAALKELRICSSNLGDAGASAISLLLKSTAMKRRHLDPSLESSPPEPEWKLEYIDLTNNDIGQAGGLALGKSLCVGMNRTLATLILDHNPLGSEGVASSDNRYLTALRMDATNSTLKRLSLKYCNIDSSGGTPLGDILTFKKTSIISLDVSRNQLSCDGLINICSGMLDNTTLETFRIADNDVGCQTDDDAKALETFATAIVKHPSLSSVDFQHNKINTRGGEILFEAIRDNKQILEFKVDPRGIDSELFKQLYRVTAASIKKKAKKGKKKK